MELLENDIRVINQCSQQKWSLENSLEALVNKLEFSATFVPISIPTEGLVSNVMICSRCGCRRQIQNFPFFSLSIPIARKLIVLLLSRNAMVETWSLLSSCCEVFVPPFPDLLVFLKHDQPHIARLSARVYGARWSRWCSMRRVDVFLFLSIGVDS